ncbi:MAG: site-specific integrase, partial [Terriglobales bacterium]
MSANEPANGELIAHFTDYLTVEKGLSPLTIEAYRGDLAQLRQFLGNRQLLTAGRRDIADFLLKLLAEQVQPRSVARKVSVFRQFFR